MNEQGSPDLPPGHQDDSPFGSHEGPAAAGDAPTGSDSPSSSGSSSSGSSFGAGLDPEAPSGGGARKKVRRSRKTRTRTGTSGGEGDPAEAPSDDAPAARKARRTRTGSSADRDDPDGAPDGAGEDGGEPPARKRRRRKASAEPAARTSRAGDDDRDDRDDDRGGRASSDGAAAEGSTATEARREVARDGAAEDGETPAEGEARKRRRRGSRGGRRRKKKTEGGDPAEEAAEGGERARPRASEERDREADREEDGDGGSEGSSGAAPADGEGQKKTKRKRRRRKKAGAKDREGDGEAAGEEDSDSDSGARAPKGRGSKSKADKPKAEKKKKRKRSRRKKSGADDDDEAEEAEPEVELSEEEQAALDEQKRVNRLLVNACEPEETRVALVNPDDRILELMMTAESQKTLVNDIYRGKVVNLEPAIGAAFIDFGQGRNGFLHTSDVLPIYGEKGFKLDQLLTASLDPEDWDGALHGEGDVDTSDDDEDDAPPGRKKRTRSGSSARDAQADGDEGDDDEGEEADGEDPEDGGSSRKVAKGRGRKGRSAKAKGKGKDDKGGRRRGRQRLPISDLLKVGDQVVVQVTKDAIGDKGPTLTTYISIPGRYLVLMPSMARTGVSRKIPDDRERRRLKRILASLDCPPEMGVIVRTAGVGRTKKDLARDLEYLLGVWEHFGKKLKHGRGPAPLYIESDVATRTLRDLFDKQTQEVVVDDPVVHEQMVEFANKLMPENAHRIRLHDGERPIFHHFGIEQDFEKVFARRVELPSGGSIVFDQTEALVAIDINSGRTRTDSHDFEEIALKTNLEAVPEIARQIRLRDLGGILVIDFIDMMKSSSNRAVERALRNELAVDKARNKLGRIGQFGLLEMTRQRLGPGTHKKVFMACGRCRGTGKIRTVESRAQAILRRLGSALTQKGFSSVEVRAHPEVVEYLKENLWDYVRAHEHRFEKELRFTAVPDQVEDSVLRYLRTDGREVRPGGRRKR